jgi:membrane fusion protein, multidrug efflux system
VVEYRRRVAASADKDPHVVVHIRLPDGSIYSHPGVTNFLDVQVQADTVTARALLLNPEGELIPGGVLGVIVERGKPRYALLVPQAAVLLDQAGHYVLVVDDSKKVEQRRITTGSDHGKDIEVENGLKEGELVITDGIQKVHPGQVVAASVVPEN